MGRAIRAATCEGCAVGAATRADWAVRAATRADWAGRSAARVSKMFGWAASIWGPAGGMPTGPVGSRTSVSSVLSGQLPSERAAASCEGVRQLFMRA